MSTPGYPPPGDPYGQPPGQPPYPPPPQYPPTSGAPYPQQQPPTSGAPYTPPVPGAPYPPQQPPTSGVPYPQQPPTSGAPYPPPAQPGYDQYQAGGYPQQPTSGFPAQPPTSGFPAATPTSGFPAPVPGYPGDPGGAYPGAPAPPQRRRGLMIGLIIAIVAVVLVGGATTAILLARGGGGEGQPSPTAAATNFLTAVYKDKDATKAARYVCSSARDKGDITKKVDEVKAYAAKFNRDPQFTWDEPKVENSGKETATVAVTVRFSTSDDRAAEQKLSITTVKNDGWLVCEIKAG